VPVTGASTGLEWRLTGWRLIRRGMTGTSTGLGRDAAMDAPGMLLIVPPRLSHHCCGHTSWQAARGGLLAQHQYTPHHRQEWPQAAKGVGQFGE